MGDKTVAFVVRKAADYARADGSLLPRYVDIEEMERDLQAVDALTRLQRPFAQLVAGCAAAWPRRRPVPKRFAVIGGSRAASTLSILNLLRANGETPISLAIDDNALNIDRVLQYVGVLR